MQGSPLKILTSALLAASFASTLPRLAGAQTVDARHRGFATRRALYDDIDRHARDACEARTPFASA